MEVAIRFFMRPGTVSFAAARGTGKSTRLRHTLPEALHLDLPRPDLQRELAARPDRLLDLVRGEPRRDTVILDEVQRVPELPNVVHSVRESNDRRRFILTRASPSIPSLHFLVGIAPCSKRFRPDR